MFFVIHWQPKRFFEKKSSFCHMCGIRISNKLVNTRDNIKEQFLVVHRIKYEDVFKEVRILQKRI